MGRTDASLETTNHRPAFDPERTAGKPGWVEMAAPALGWAMGLLIIAWPTFSSGFSRVQGGLGDSRLINFSLEHTFRWIMGWPLADSLWSPPIFFPVEGVSTYTDLMLGVAPLYWLWRWFGFEPHTAYQLWMLACWSVNFLGCYLLLSKGLRIPALGSTAGAYLFAFGSPRWMSMAHQQLGPQFWLLLSLAGLLMILRPPNRPPRARRWIANLAFWGGLVAQLYTSVYLLAFFVLGLAAATGVALIVPRTRRAVLAVARCQLVPLLVGGLVAIVFAAPLAVRYGATARVVGMHAYRNIHMPKPLSWVLPGNSSRVYGKIQRSWDLAEYRGFSQTNGVGPVTMLLCIAGLWIGRRRPEVLWVAAGSAGLVLMTMTLPGGWSPWILVREVVPGSAALRAVARVGLMMLFPAALGLALFVNQMSVRRRWLLAAILLLVVAAEQTHRRPSFDKAAAINRVERIASRVPVQAESFLLVIDGPRWDKYLHDDAAWVAIKAAVPTVNGRYGHFPPNYPFRTATVEGPEERAGYRRLLDEWVEDRGGDSSAAVIIEVAPRAERKRSRRP